MTDLTALREAAEAATPGPWRLHERYPDLVCSPDGNSIISAEGDILTDEQIRKNAAYILASQPAAIIALLDTLAAEKAARERAEAATEQARKALEETRTDLSILKKNITNAAKSDARWDGMPDVVQRWIDRNDAALKEPT